MYSVLINIIWNHYEFLSGATDQNISSKQCFLTSSGIKSSLEIARHMFWSQNHFINTEYILTIKTSYSELF